MINRLINLDVSNLHNDEKLNKTNDYSVNEYVKSFLNGMSRGQKIRFKKMIEHGIISGDSIAKNYGISYEDFILEVKKQLNIKENK